MAHPKKPVIVYHITGFFCICIVIFEPNSAVILSSLKILLVFCCVRFRSISSKQFVIWRVQVLYHQLQLIKNLHQIYKFIRYGRACNNIDVIAIGQDGLTKNVSVERVISLPFRNYTEMLKMPFQRALQKQQASHTCLQ